MGQNHTQRRKSDGTKSYTEEEERWDKIIHRERRAMGQNHTQRRKSDGPKSCSEKRRSNRNRQEMGVERLHGLGKVCIRKGEE